MRYLLDTNVVSEQTKPRPNLSVELWLRAQPALDLAISVLTLGELQQGLTTLPAHRRKEKLASWIRTDLPRQFTGRVLPVDEQVALEWGRLRAEGLNRGRALPVIDGLLLATAAVHGLTLVTRNASDCADRGVPVLNPWNAA